MEKISTINIYNNINSQPYQLVIFTQDTHILFGSAFTNGYEQTVERCTTMKYTSFPNEVFANCIL
jgi:hypothetical protein